ncbi:amidohydrolase [Geosporobacter ferrireducens]|uniref:amidohydrolase n=1 Tax=Geosporobacter ferrireducens TaxID=1424294 RepID=UPI00139E1A63|nr:amidohydrolase [Geosporobacter ferrireducens]MTI58041.1 amidohydrolase [Geosporobacter ferrireducens]
MDVIYFNGNIITMDEKNPKAEAVAVKGGRIVNLGENQEIKSLQNQDTVMIDLENRTMVPGFHDSHMHLLHYGASLQQVDLTGVTSVQEMIHRCRTFAEGKIFNSVKWMEGRGWNQDFFIDNNFPTRYDLDQITTDYPICLARACGHVAVVNSKALEVMDVVKHTPQIHGGHFDVDESGEPLGIFREKALKLIYEHIPEPKLEDIKQMILDASVLALRQGITSVQTDDFEALPVKDFEIIIRAYQELQTSRELPIRVYEQCLLPTVERLERFLNLGYYTGQGDEFFKIGPLKLLCDGSLGARTAYLWEPYADDPTNYGISIYTQEVLDRLVAIAHNAGMQLAIHCIGDKVMDMAFDSIEKAQQGKFRENARHGIIHCQITDETLLNRYKELDVIAHIQPIFIDYDLHIVEQRVGKERAKTSYNWRTMMEKGVHVACGSDCPVEPFDVMPGIYAAVTRKDLKGHPPGGWMPEQRLTVQQALYGFTLGAAYASFEENFKGSIAVGKAADFAVLSEDIFTIESDKLKDVKVLMTVIDGRIMYKKDLGIFDYEGRF